MNYHPLNQSTYVNGQPIGSIELKLLVVTVGAVMWGCLHD